MMPILHLTRRADWDAAKLAGRYEAASLHSEGFIHFSTADQVVRVANAFYSGQSDLVLLVVDPERITADLRWEAPAHPGISPDAPEGELFPHVYGPLNVNAVIRVIAFPPTNDGTFRLPDEF
jgi:uncharacterized protein (DUF952 family)